MNEDKFTRYHRLRRRAGILAVIARVGLLLALLGFWFSPALRNLSAERALVTGVPELLRPSTEVALYALMLAILAEAVVLPLIWYAEFVLDRRYGLSRRRAGDWTLGHVTTTGIHLAAWTAAAVVVCSAMRLWPTSWWMMAGVVFAGGTIAVTHLVPMLVLSRICHVGPLVRPGLRIRLENLPRRVWAPAMGILEWRLGRDTPRPNAALVGIGPTRGVLLTDALLTDYSDDEIEVVLAHELGHHAHRDIWKTIVYEAVAATLAFGAAHGALRWVGPSVGVEGRFGRRRFAPARSGCGVCGDVAGAGHELDVPAPRAAGGSVCARGDRQPGRARVRVAPSGRAVSRGGATVTPRRMVVLLASATLSDRLAAVRLASPPG